MTKRKNNAVMQIKKLETTTLSHDKEAVTTLDVPVRKEARAVVAAVLAKSLRR